MTKTIDKEIPKDIKELSNKIKEFPMKIKDNPPSTIKYLKNAIMERSPTGERKLNAGLIAKTLLDNWHFVLIGANRDFAILYTYDPSKGIYVSSVNFIGQLIYSVEYRTVKNDWKNVIEILRLEAPLVQSNTDKHLIAVGNGIFDTKTKELRPFSPKYIFTSKVKTNYVDSPTNVDINGWNVENWLLSLVDNDAQMVTLLYQMMNEAINPNYTRKKIGFLVGEGNSGKGTFQQLLVNLLGFENISTLKIEEFGGDSHKFRKSMLLGKTCNIGDDISRTPVDTVSDLMSIATGDPITV